MRFSATPPDWESDDTENLRKFFDSRTGQRLLARLDWERPDLVPSGDATARLISAGQIEGYEMCESFLFALSQPPVVPHEPTEQYPDLDDDDKWKSLGLDKHASV